jgi:IclR family pca regulon transcriptional regulator
VARSSPNKRAQADYRIEALSKGLRVLGLFNERRPSMRLTDMATEADITLPSTYRIAMTLLGEGFLEQLPDGSYRPAPRVLTLGFAALSSLDFVQLAMPVLERLAARTQETVNLAVLSGDRVLYLARLRNADLVTANIQVGSTLPATYTSIGKLLLAFLDDGELRARITDASFGNGGPRAVSDLDELLPDLEAIRRRGYALQDEELAYGLRSVAAPVRDSNGPVVAGINVAVNALDWPVKRLTRELRPQVVDAGIEISRLLGWRG